MSGLQPVENTRPIFVIGTPRSGTTLMARVLNRHSRIFMPGETHFFPDIYAQRDKLGELPEEAASNRVWDRLTSLYRRYNEPKDQARIDAILEDAKSREHLRTSMQSYREVFSTFMEIQTEREGKVRWGNNTPKDLFYVEDILEFYPDAQFIICVRDIRDFLKSYQGKWKVTADSEVDRLKKLYHPVITSLLWKSSMRKLDAIRRKLPENKLLTVRYEDMVSQPEVIMKKVCEYIGEDFDAQMLDINFSNSSDQKSQTGIYARSVSSWKGKLSSEEVWIAQRLGGQQMQSFGYSIELVKVNAFKLMGILFSTPWALGRALKANRSNTGPIIPYVYRRITGLLGR